MSRKIFYTTTSNPIQINKYKSSTNKTNMIITNLVNQRLK